MPARCWSAECHARVQLGGVFSWQRQYSPVDHLGNWGAVQAGRRGREATKRPAEGVRPVPIRAKLSVADPAAAGHHGYAASALGPLAAAATTGPFFFSVHGRFCPRAQIDPGGLDLRGGGADSGRDRVGRTAMIGVPGPHGGWTLMTRARRWNASAPGRPFTEVIQTEVGDETGAGIGPLSRPATSCLAGGGEQHSRRRLLPDQPAEYLGTGARTGPRVVPRV